MSKSVRTRRDARLFPSSTCCSSILRPDGPGTGRESEMGLRFAVSVELVLGSRIVGLGESLEEVETDRLARKAFSAEAWRACYGVDSPINDPYQTVVPRAFPARIPQWVLAFVTVQTRPSTERLSFQDNATRPCSASIPETLCLPCSGTLATSVGVADNPVIDPPSSPQLPPSCPLLSCAYTIDPALASGCARLAMSGWRSESPVPRQTA